VGFEYLSVSDGKSGEYQLLGRAVSKRDLYEVLGIQRNASQDEIKKAYRRKAKESHPDANPGDASAADKFREVEEANSILSDPEKRKAYDQFGHAAFQQGPGGGPGAGGFGFSGGEGFEEVFGDIFSSFFGGGGGAQSAGRRTRGRPGRDLKYDLEITFEEAAFGLEKPVELMRRTACTDCEGTGAARGTSPETCQHCNGAGQVRSQQGFFTVSRTCPVCSGSGRMVKNPCSGCNGSGLKVKQSKINVRVPAGIDNGQRLKLRGEGEAGTEGGPDGDLYVQIHVKAHDFFRREESEVLCDVPISYTMAVLGGETQVPTIDGMVNLKVPAGTPSGKVFRMKGKGITVLGANRRGDQHTRVMVEVPKKVSEERRRLLEQLAKLEEEEGAHEQKGFFGRLKDVFM
jgi:molecular chaperone DnaJ